MVKTIPLPDANELSSDTEISGAKESVVDKDNLIESFWLHEGCECNDWCLNELTESIIVRNVVDGIRHFDDSGGLCNEWQLCGVVKHEGLS